LYNFIQDMQTHLGIQFPCAQILMLGGNCLNYLEV